MIFICYSKCSTCQKAKKWLDEQDIKDKLPTMNEEEQLKLLATNGMLVKRPLVVNGDMVLIGFKEAEWAEKLS